MTRTELIAALKSAKGPGLELDAQIWFFVTHQRHAADKLPPERYTASIDAAVALIESVRPGAHWSLYSDNSAALWSLDKPEVTAINSATPAIALCIALLESMEQANG